MIDRLDRWVLTVAGIFMVVAGTAGLLAATNVLDTDDDPGVIYERARDAVAALPWGWWPVLFGVVVVAMVGGLWLLAHQFRSRTGIGADVRLVEHHPQGWLEVSPAPLARALAADLRRLPSVRDSAVRLLALGPTAEVRLWLDVLTGTELSAVLGEVEEALDRFATATGSARVDAEVRLDLGAHGPSRRVA